MDFNTSITHVMAKTVEHLSDFVFVSVANTTLARRDSYLWHLKSGIKPDTLASLRMAPLQMATLFPDDVLKQAEQDIANFESKGHILARKVASTHMNIQRNDLTGNQTDQPGKTLEIMARARRARARLPTIHHNQPRGSSHTSDNYCINVLQTGLLPGSKQIVNAYQLPHSRRVTKKTMNFQTRDNLSANLNVVTHVPIAKRAFAKERCKSCHCKLLQREIKICEKCFNCLLSNM